MVKIEKIRIEDYINITPDSRSATYMRGQILITVPLAERQRAAENLAVIMRKYPHRSKSELMLVAADLMADQIRNDSNFTLSFD